MLTTPHFLVGITIALSFSNPLAVLALSIISHFVLDFFVPHWNPHIYTEFNKNGKISKNSFAIILFDGLIAVFFVLLFAWKNLYNYPQLLRLFCGAVGATLPDIVEIPYYFFGCKTKCLKKYVEFAHKNQSNSVFWLGIITQVATIVVCLKILFF